MWDLINKQHISEVSSFLLKASQDDYDWRSIEESYWNPESLNLWLFAFLSLFKLETADHIFLNDISGQTF